MTSPRPLLQLYFRRQCLSCLVTSHNPFLNFPVLFHIPFLQGSHCCSLPTCLVLVESVDVYCLESLVHYRSKHMPDCLGQTKIADSEPLMSMLESKIELVACCSKDLKTSHVVETQIPHSSWDKVPFEPCIHTNQTFQPPPFPSRLCWHKL
jgi:hypothetical protein